VDRRRLAAGPVVEPHHLLHAPHGVARAAALDLDDELLPRPRPDDRDRPRLAGMAVKRIKPNILSERFDESSTTA
jgi:hypothetical protein